MIRSGEEILAKMGRQVTPSFLSPKFMQSMPILKEERGSDEFGNTNSDSMIRSAHTLPGRAQLCRYHIFIFLCVFLLCIFHWIWKYSMNLVSAELIGANACYLSDDSKATCFVLTRVQNTSNAIIIPTFGQGSANWVILPSWIREHGLYLCLYTSTRLGKPSCKKSAVFFNIVQKALDPPFPPHSFEHF